MFRSFSLSLLTITILIVLVFFFTLPRMVTAGEPGAMGHIFSLRLSPEISPFLSGDAGTGQGAPDFDDLFDDGYGLILEAECRLRQSISLIGGIGYQKYDGGSREGLKFDNLETVPIYLGCKFHIPSYHMLQPFIQVHAGVMHLSSVDVKWNTLSMKYWNASWVFLGGAGIGFDYRISSTLNITAGVDLRYAGAPENNLDAADADGFWTLPIHFGISYSF